MPSYKTDVCGLMMFSLTVRKPNCNNLKLNVFCRYEKNKTQVYKHLSSIETKLIKVILLIKKLFLTENEADIH